MTPSSSDDMTPQKDYSDFSGRVLTTIRTFDQMDNFVAGMYVIFLDDGAFAVTNEIPPEDLILMLEQAIVLLEKGNIIPDIRQ